MKKLNCVNEYAEAVKTNNWTFMEEVLWNEESARFETESGLIESLGGTEKEKGEQVFNYVLTKIARYLGTYKHFIDIIENTSDFLTIRVRDDMDTDMSFQKNRLPELLNETRRII